MASSDFEKLVKEFASQQEVSKAENIRLREETVQWWQDKITALYNSIETWLQPLVQSQAVVPSRQRIPISEESIGAYQVDALILSVASKRLEFKPKGTMLIGAFGRVDISGPNGNASLLLLPTDPKAPASERRQHVEWFVMKDIGLQRTRGSQPAHRRLDKENFEQLFTDLFGIL